MLKIERIKKCKKELEKRKEDLKSDIKFAELDYREYYDFAKEEKKYVVNPTKFHILSVLTLGIYYIAKKRSYYQIYDKVELEHFRRKCDLLRKIRYLKRQYNVTLINEQEIELFLQFYDNLSEREKIKLLGE